MKVYLLYEYGEDGPHDIFATLDPSKLVTVLDRLDLPERLAYLRELYPARLKEALDDGTVGSYALSDGWGGYVLDIVELAE